MRPLHNLIRKPGDGPPPTSQSKPYRALVKALAVFLLFAIEIGFTHCHSAGQGGEGESKKDKSKRRQSAGANFEGGIFEASGVVQVGADAVIFIDDSRPGEVMLMQMDEAGRQKGEIKHLKLGVSTDDPEAITTDGSYFYIIGSQSKPKGGENNGLIRFALDPGSQSVTRAEVIKDLRAFLIANVPELKGEGEKKGEDGGLNIEGIAWDPGQNRLLLGLRSPVLNGQAMLVPIRLKDANGPFAVENLLAGEPRAIALSLGGQGVRDIHYDARAKSFFIISGAPEHHEKEDFKLWQWSGASAAREVTTLDRKMKPEGITVMRASGREFIFIVGDASAYLSLDYPEAQ
jgi:hypothetical protein